MRVHVALAVSDLTASVAEYSALLQSEPLLVIPGQYALFRTDVLNLSLRSVEGAAGVVRHLGFERDDAPRFAEYRDRDGVVWETFSKEQQAEEIRSTWPSSDYVPSADR